MRKANILLLLISTLWACEDYNNSRQKKELKLQELKLPTPNDGIRHIHLTSPDKITEEETEFQRISDSIKRAKIDTSTLELKRNYILNKFEIENSPIGVGIDTLIDLNFDNLKDYVITYYSPCGMGVKNGIDVYMYNPSRETYILDSFLSSLRNPTFYLSDKKITSFYIAGSGMGARYEWVNNKWVLTKKFEVDGHDTSSNCCDWNIEFPLSGKMRTVNKPYEYTPPQEVLENNIDWLDATN